MIDTEHVKCDTCTAPEPMELDASDEASRCWPTVDIETNPYKGQFPLFQQHPEIAFLDSAATAQRPACVLDAERDFYQRMNANPCAACTRCPSRPPTPSRRSASRSLTSSAPHRPTRSSSPATRASRSTWSLRALRPQCSNRATRSSSPLWSTTPT